MCGISGIISLDGNPIQFLEKRMELMTKSLHHRGPDQSGIYCSKKKNFGLSNNRLSIVSPDEKLSLPFTKDSKTFLSFNGEIYNYKEIKELLKKKNIKFQTETDTEVLYEYLKLFNNDSLDKLNGMWSFAIYDEERHQLLLSRDLLGERHLFYLIENNELIFSSEPKPIVMASLNKHYLDFDSIVTSWKFNSCSPDKTLVKNLFRLKPGHNLIFESNKIEVKRFQMLKPEKWFNFFSKNPSIKEIDKEFEKIFLNEVNLRLPKEIDFCTPLSGGVDSTILVNFINKFLKNFKTFFAVTHATQQIIKDKDRNNMTEAYFSEHLAHKFNTDHETIIINRNFDKNELEEHSKNCFDGCIDFGVINYSSISKYINSKKSKVIMFAEGPDELLGGYQADIESNKIDKIFSGRRYLQPILKNRLIKYILIGLFKLKKNIEFEFSYEPFYTRVNHLVSPNKFLNNIVENFDQKKMYEYGIIDKDYEGIFFQLDNSQKRALIYATKTLPDMFNLRADKGFMRHSVEVRLPFQSIKLVEFFIAMPSHLRFKNDFGKYYLRKYVEKKIDKFVSQAPKTGMGSAVYYDEDNKELIEMRNTIKQTDFFSFFPFKKDIKKTLLDKKTHPANLWTAFTLINTFKELNKINEEKK